MFATVFFVVVEHMFVYNSDMLEALRTGIEALELHPDELAEVIALRDRLDAHIARAAGEFDAAKLWELDGETSLTGWLKAHARMYGGDAARLSRLAGRMRSHPVTAQAWRAGGLSSGQVLVAERIVKRYAVELFAEHEAAVVPALERLSVPETMVAMNEWAQAAEAVLDPRPDDLDDDERPGTITCSRTPDGSGLVRGTLSRECRQLLETVMRLAATKDGEGEPKRTWAQIRHDAVRDVLKWYCDNQDSHPGGSHRPHLNVIVSHDDLANGLGGRYADGSPVDGVTVSTYLCDCTVHRVLVDQTTMRIDYGRDTNTISAELRTVLVVRDRGCRFPGCDRPATWCDGHHVTWWRRNGTTDQHNLVLLCRKHHRTLHKRGWHAKLEPDGTFTVTYPDGRTATTRPPGLDPPHRAIPA